MYRTNFLSIFLFATCAVCLLLPIDHAAAQQRSKTDANIFGHVIDDRTGEHLPYAFVLLKEQNIGAQTDSSGHFFISHLKEGKHTVEVSFLGYATYTGTITTETGESREYNFALKPVENNLEQVVVTGNRYATKKRETGQIVNVVSPKTFECAIAMTPAEVLDFKPGLRVEYDCGNCGLPQLRINGLAGEYTQVLLDSRPVFSSLSMVYGLEQLPAAMIERVEVVRGGGSALFGSNAIGGTVNIITKEPIGSDIQLSNQSGVVGGSVADINTTLNASLVSEDRKTGTYIFSSVRNRGAYDRNDDGFSDMPGLKNETIGMRTYYKFSDKTKLTAEYHHIHEFRRGGDNLNRPPHEAMVAEQLEHRIDGGGLSVDTQAGNNFFGAYTSAQGIKRNSYYGAGMDPDAYGNTSDFILNSGLQYNHHFDKLAFMPATLSAGFDFSFNKLHDIITGYDRDLRQTTRQGGLYVQNEWTEKKGGILLGIRADKHNLTENLIVSPRITLRYAPTDNWTFRAGYAKGFRAPQAYDEDLHISAVGGEVSLISLAEDLKPENSHALTASVDYWLQSGKWQFNILAEGFYTKLQDVFTLEENGRDESGNLLLIRANESGAYVTGANVEAMVAKGDDLVFQSGFTVQRSRYLEPLQWSEDVPAQTKMFNAPDLYGYMTVQGKFSEHLSASFNGTWTGPLLIRHYAGFIESDTETMTPSFLDLSARIARHFHLSSQTRLEVSVSCKNILDQHQKDLDVGAEKDSQYLYGPVMPRSFYLGAKLSF